MIGFNERSFSNAVFEGIEWNTERVFASSLQHLISEGLRVSIMPELRDIDTPEDIHEYLRQYKEAENTSSTYSFLNLACLTL